MNPSSKINTTMTSHLLLLLPMLVQMLKSLESLNDRVRALVSTADFGDCWCDEEAGARAEVLEEFLVKYLALSLKLLTSNGHFFWPCPGKRLRSSMTTSFLGAI